MHAAAEELLVMQLSPIERISILAMMMETPHSPIAVSPAEAFERHELVQDYLMTSRGA